jgi:hypothetical protein
MTTSVRHTIRRITKENGLGEIRQSHYLQGSFVQLCEPRTMLELLFPGTPSDVLRMLPKTLTEVLSWPDLDLDLDKIVRNACEVLNNIKVKGARQGNVMDEETERVLLPQIGQEALAKGVVEAVRRLNLKVSSTVAKVARATASIDSPRAQRDQLEEECIERYLNFRCSTQEEYVGDEWVLLIRDDLRRFVVAEKMSTVDASGQVVVINDESIRVQEVIPYATMCWLDVDEKMKEKYPAFFELLDAMHCLPHELNCKRIIFFTVLLYSDVLSLFHDSLSVVKCNFRNMQLLEAGRGCTMLLRFPPGSRQHWRIDNRGGPLDSGIR